MPVSTTEVLSESNFMSVTEAKRLVESAYGNLIPETKFRTNGPASYYQIPGRAQRIGFIGAMTNMHFCENCNKLRLTCDGKLRPCLGSYLSLTSWDRCGRARAMNSSSNFFSTWSSESRRNTILKELPAQSQNGCDRRLSAVSCHVERSETSLII